METSTPTVIFVAAASGVSAFAVFAAANMVVQTVVLLLAAALVWWLIVSVSKLAELQRVGQDADAFERLFWSGPRSTSFTHP